MAISMDAIEMGKFIGPVTVGFVEKPDTVWISVDAPRDSMMDKIDNVKTYKKLGQASVGGLGAAIFSEDGSYYRVKVLNIIDDQVEVRFCDFGNIESKTINELYELPLDLREQSELAFSVKVDGVINVSNSSKNRARVEKKLNVEGLMVKLDVQGNDLVGTFQVEDKLIKFTKSKDIQEKESNVDSKKGETSDDRHATNALNGESVGDDVVVEEVKPIIKRIMVCDLPSLKLLEGVEIAGSVVYVSPQGSVWFSPDWIQSSLHAVSLTFDQLMLESKLNNLSCSSFQPGVLCVSRSLEDESLYRSKIVSFSSDKVCVQYIDFGNFENLPLINIYEFPDEVERMAPAAAEVFSARKVPIENPSAVLEKCLMEVEQLVLVLETVETGGLLGRFYVNGCEVKWDTSVTNMGDCQENMANSEANILKSVGDTMEPSSTSKDMNRSDGAGTRILKPKLIKFVPAAPLLKGEDVPVSLAHVENIRRVWVSRTDDENRIGSIMDKLAALRDDLQSATRLKKGAVYGAVWHQDGEVYRIVIKNIVEEEIDVQFIDFGNYEKIKGCEALDIPEDIGKEAAGAFLVELSHDLEANTETLAWLEELLDIEGITVSLENQGYVFKINGRPISFDIHYQRQDKVDSSEVISHADEPLSGCTVSRDASNNCMQLDESAKKQIELAVKYREPIVDIPSNLDEKVKANAATSKLDEKVKANVATSTTKMSRSFMKAMSDFQQCQQERHASIEISLEKNSFLDSPWTVGQRVVVQWPDRIWRISTVQEIDVYLKQVVVTNESQEIRQRVNFNDVRPDYGMPVDALNNIECSLVSRKGDGASASDLDVAPILTHEKVSNWIGKNSARTDQAASKPVQSRILDSSIFQKVLPPEHELTNYSTSHSGSLHLQSLLNCDNVELSMSLLSSMLCHPLGLFSLMINKNSSYVIQKLLEVLPPSSIEPLVSHILSNFVKLSLDCYGCRVVQTLLNSCALKKNRVFEMFTNANTALVLSTDRYGTYVAQACLSHMIGDLSALCTLVTSLLGHLSVIGKTQSGSYFLQRLADILITHYKDSDVTGVFVEEVLTNMSQLIAVECGSRLIQSVIKTGFSKAVIRVSKWLEENMEVVINVKPAVHVAFTVLECLIVKVKEGGIWPAVLSQVMKGFVSEDRNSSKTRSYLTSASLHESGHRLVKKIVSNFDVYDESTVREMMKLFALDVDVLSVDRYGVEVLKTLGSGMQ